MTIAKRPTFSGGGFFKFISSLVKLVYLFSLMDLSIFLLFFSWVCVFYRFFISSAGFPIMIEDLHIGDSWIFVSGYVPELCVLNNPGSWDE